MTHHTPGPWDSIRSERFPEYYVRGVDGSHVCIVPWLKHDQDACDANARLIAAAPLMLNALQMIAAGTLRAEQCAEFAQAAIATAVLS